MYFEKKYYKYKKKYTESKNSMKSMIGGSNPFNVVTGQNMEENNEILYYQTNDGLVLHTSNTNGPIELKRGRTQLYSTDMDNILSSHQIMYENGELIWQNKADQSFDDLIKSDLIESIELRFNGEEIKQEITKSAIERLDQFYTKIMIIINFKEAYDKDYWVLNGIDLYNDRKSVNFERNVDISLLGKTLFVEPTNSSEIKKTLEELKKEITEKKESEKTLLDRIDQTINISIYDR